MAPVKRVTLRVEVVGDGGKILESHTMSNMPEDLIQRYLAVAEKLLPEKGEAAWAELIIGHIMNSTREGAHQFVMTGVPQEAIDNISEALAPIGLNFASTMAMMFNAGRTDRFHILNFRPANKEPETSKQHFMIISGWEDDLWARLDDPAKKLPSMANAGQPMRGEELLGLLLEQADLRVEANNEQPKTARTVQSARDDLKPPATGRS